jgi:hypothetical protein
MTMNLPELSLKLADAGYVADRDWLLHLRLLQRPLLLEGAVLGKPKWAKALAMFMARTHPLAMLRGLIVPSARERNTAPAHHSGANCVRKKYQRG